MQKKSSDEWFNFFKLITERCSDIQNKKLFIRRVDMKEEFQGGVWPVMLTPFTKEGQVDGAGLKALIEWYLDQGVQGLFSICQSSEVFKLSLGERVRIAKITVDTVAERVKVIASGHISDDLDDQVKEINAIAATGVDAVILITNRLAKKEESDEVWLKNLNYILDRIPSDIKLGAYECPYPYKRLMSIPIIEACAKTGRFYFLKDTSCDAKEIREKLKVIQGTNLKLYNANTSTLLESLQDGSFGYSGVMANFHPKLYVWLWKHYQDANAKLVQEILMACSLIEKQLYPVNAKYHLKEIENLPITSYARIQDQALLTDTFKKEVHMMDSLCKRIYTEYCLK